VSLTAVEGSWARDPEQRGEAVVSRDLRQFVLRSSFSRAPFVGYAFLEEGCVGRSSGKSGYVLRLPLGSNRHADMRDRERFL
jgi:hypothetical protein